MQSGEILIQDAEILLGGDEPSPQGGKILARDDKIPSQGSKILVQEGEILSQSGAGPQQGDKISSKRAEGEISSQSQSDKISPPSGESVFSDLPSTYVPFRNGVFLSIAAALAEKERCDAIFIGVVQEDSSGYPDCSAGFIGAFERALELGTSRDFHPRIKTPLVHLSKVQIVSLALEIGVPLELTWSCYEREDAACGLCDSCLLRLKGFAGVGAKDKIPYAIEA
ncbi:7-cyano-7-deazaguanine synthase [uncultured Campylobacter sp.]|uniref:7-cyano-7-deazaguanine synthase n=1 Tax=uncultured Campylobacter sp. TaxID=218934 RepID=UPI00260B8240|nr:7-cyano-7-deazaguanine synthase [uncultured Campylobacter sp.]